MPKIPEGKAKSTRNATKHGVLSNEPLLVNDNPACYEGLLHPHIERFQPAVEVDLEIVHVMAFAKWRQRRAWNNETAMIDMQMHEEQGILKAKFEKFDEATRIAHAVGTLSDESSKLLANSRYESRFHRMHYRAMNQLLALQDRRCSPDQNRGHSGREPNESSTGQVAVSPISLPPNAPNAANDQNRGHSGRKPNESSTGQPAVSPIFPSPNARHRSPNPPLPQKPRFPNELPGRNPPPLPATGHQVSNHTVDQSQPPHPVRDFNTPAPGRRRATAWLEGNPTELYWS